MQAMEGWKTIVGGILIVAVIGFALGFIVRGLLFPVATTRTTNQTNNQPLIGARQTPMPTQANSQTGTTPVPQAIVSDSGNIKVYTPFQDDLVSSPFVLKGEARVFENSLNFRLTDVSGNIISEGNLMADAPDIGKFGKFEANIEYSTPSDFGTLEVFSLSAKDGSEINLVQIQLKFE